MCGYRALGSHGGNVGASSVADGRLGLWSAAPPSHRSHAATPHPKPATTAIIFLCRHAQTGKNSGNNLGPETPVVHFEQWEEDQIEVKLILKEIFAKKGL